MSGHTLSRPDEVFRQLVARVLSGRYAAGDRLPPQRALAAELGVNMASLREGIKRLEQLRLLDVRHGDAMRVRPWREHAGLDVLAYAAGDPDALRSLLEARRVLLEAAARLAAQRRAEAQALQLAALAARLRGAEDSEEAQRLDFEFFETLIAAADNLVFALIVNSIRELYFESRDVFRPLVAELDRLAPLYEAGAAAIGRRDAEAAAAAVARLAARQEAQMISALET